MCAKKEKKTAVDSQLKMFSAKVHFVVFKGKLLSCSYM